jgi:phasin family protein
MSTFPEQFSEARKSQLDVQFNLIRTFTGKAFDSAEKIMALNFDASRASLEKSSALVRQIMEVRDPRDLFALTREGQSQFDSVMAYGRQLFSIVAAPAVPAATETAPALDAPVAAPAASATEAPPAPVQASLMPEAGPVAAEGEAAPEPIAEPNAVAKAAGKPAELPKPIAASFPVTSSSKPIAVAPVKPVEAAPPPAPVSGTPEIVTRKAAAPAAKPAKKK